jgi:addiction module HigA family antidote
MVRVPTNRHPTHPGEMLLEEFLKPMDLTQQELAHALGVPYQRINELINGRRGLTPSTALRLAKYFGNLDELATALGSLRSAIFRGQIPKENSPAPRDGIISDAGCRYRNHCALCSTNSLISLKR